MAKSYIDFVNDQIRKAKEAYDRHAKCTDKQPCLDCVNAKSWHKD